MSSHYLYRIYWLGSIVCIIDVIVVRVHPWLTGANYVPCVTNKQWLEKDIYT